MKKVIALFNNKGGVGKSTASIVLSHAIAEKGKRVLCIDLDPQGNLTSMYTEDESVKDYYIEELKESVQSLYSLVHKVEMDIDFVTEQRDYYVEDLLVDRELDIHRCIYKTKFDNLDILPASIRLSEIEERLKADIRTPQQFRLKEHIEKIRDEYDYIFLDLAPNISIININGLAVATDLIVPLKADKWSADGATNAVRLMNTVQLYNPGLQLAGFFINQYEKKNVTKTFKELFESVLGNHLLPFTIKKSKVLEEMITMKIPLLEYDKRQRYEVTRTYAEFAEYLMKGQLR